MGQLAVEGTQGRDSAGTLGQKDSDSHTGKGVTVSQRRGKGLSGCKGFQERKNRSCKGREVSTSLVDPGLEVVMGTWIRRWLEMEGRPELCQPAIL